MNMLKNGYHEKRTDTGIGVPKVKTISVIVVSHKTGPVLERVIASVLAQDSGIELVLVNNGNPPEIETNLIERFKETRNVRIMTGHGDIGLVAGRNLGARMAKGDYLLFLDERCILAKSACSFLRALAAGEEGLSFVLGAKIVDTKGKERPMDRCALLTPKVGLGYALGLGDFFPRFRLDLSSQPLNKELMAVPAIGGDFMFLSRDTFNSCGGFNEKYFPLLSALLFCLQMEYLEGHVLFTPQALARYEGGAKKASTPQEEKKKFLALTHYYENEFSHRYPIPFIWALNLVNAGRLGIGVLLKRPTTVL